MTPLSSELKIKSITLRNRLVLPPITTNYGSSKGLVTQAVLDFYRDRAKDVGLVIVEATSVQATGRIVPGSLGLWDDSQVSPIAKLVKTIQKQGAHAVVQLSHAGPRCPPVPGKRHGFSPSGVRFRPDVEPIVMNAGDIGQLIRDFSRAALRAQKAGFDGVEIHGAHLYLLSQFLSPLTNKREDQYGGDAKGRACLALEIVREVRKHLGPDYPLFFRINAVERIPGGLSLEEALVMGKLLKDAGVDVFDVTLIAQGGWKEADGKTWLTGSSALPKDLPSGANIPLAAAFKKETGLPVIAVGKFGIGDAALRAVQDENIDLIAVGRQMICDPETAKKMLTDRDRDIIACEECLQCFATIGRSEPMACKINPDLPGGRS
jgi:2,4-dienoyl-CoA reductase-like NADH-dependent reductase (Old Yellow Enzyme family)